MASSPPSIPITLKMLPFASDRGQQEAARTQAWAVATCAQGHLRCLAVLWSGMLACSG